MSMSVESLMLSDMRGRMDTRCLNMSRCQGLAP